MCLDASVGVDIVVGFETRASVFEKLPAELVSVVNSVEYDVTDVVIAYAGNCI